MKQLLYSQVLYIYDDKQNKQAVVVDNKDRTYIFSMSSTSVVKRLCKLYGTSFEYHRSLAKEHLHYKQMIPIPIKAHDNYIMVPFCSLRKQNLWVNYAYVRHVESLFEKYSVLYLDQQRFCLYMSKRSVRKQLKRVVCIQKLWDTL